MHLWFFPKDFCRTSLGVISCLVALACQAGPGSTLSTQTDVELEPTHLLVTGGTVVTMDGDGTVFPDGAVAIEDGRITAVGSRAELEADHSGARQVSANGGVILPGLINAHTHVPMVLFRGLADDLELMDWLENHIFPAEAEHVDEEFVRVGTRLACLEMLRGGITTFVDGYYFEDAIAEEAESCGMRAVLGSTLIDFPAPDNKTWDDAVAYARKFVESTSWTATRWSSKSTVPRLASA